MFGPGPTDAGTVKSSSDAYAEGMVALISDQSRLAAEHFTEATRLRPDFGIANRELAQAIMTSGSAPGTGVRATFTESTVEKAIDALQAARANHADTASVNSDLGAMLFHRSVRTKSIDDMRQSVAFTRAGLRLGTAYEHNGDGPHINQLIGEANLALGLLGLGDTDGAIQAYKDVGDQISAVPAHLRSFVVSAALTPLELLHRSARPPSDAVLTSVREALVGAGYDVTSTSEVTVESVEPEAFSAVLQWHAQFRGFDPDRDDLAVQWYRYDPKFESWRALWSVSGPLSFDGTEPGGLYYADTAAGQDTYWGNSAGVLPDGPSACVENSRYRLDFYVNGKLISTREAHGPPENYIPTLAGDGSVALCTPPGWSVENDPGTSTSLLSEDQLRGLYIFNVHEPWSLSGDDHRISALERIVRTKLPGLSGDDAAAASPVQPIILGTSETIWRTYPFSGGTAKVGATDLGSGIVTVVCAFGPEGWVESDEAVSLLETLVPR
jgi:hypothetical protein